MTVEMEVTAEDIATGKRGDCFECAVAVAISRTIGYEVHVVDDSFRIEEPWNFIYAPLVRVGPSFRLARDVTRKIRDLDAGVVMEPFSFSVAIPQRYIAPPCQI